MPTELSELVADIKEQVAYLREIGVESFEVTLPEASAVQVAAEKAVYSVPQQKREALPTSTPIIKAPPPKIEIEGPPRKTRTGARLASLPSLKKRAVAPLNADTQNTSDARLSPSVNANFTVCLRLI